MARLLIGAGADVNALDQMGTALHRAARYGHDRIIALLLDAGADPSAVDHEGRTALDLIRPFEETLDHYLSFVSQA